MTDDAPIGDRISQLEDSVARLAKHRFDRVSTEIPAGFIPPVAATPTPDVAEAPPAETDASASVDQPD